MTISTEVRKAGPFTGNGTASVFPFAFKVFKAQDMVVVRRQENIQEEIVLVLNSDYTVTLNANQDASPGGTVTLTAGPLASGYTMVVTSELPYLQPTDLTNQGGFYPKVVTNALDRLTIFCQQLRGLVDRSLKLPITAPEGISTELPFPSPKDLIGWDEQGEGLTNYSPQSLVTSIAYGSATADLFAGDGVTTTFPLTLNPASINNLDVSINGLSQRPVVGGVGDYTWNGGATITFVTPPPSPSAPGDKNVLVRYMQAIPVSDADSLHAQAMEALRRSLAEAGYRVVGTFQTGFTYANANDVGIDEATGKGYTGPVGDVAAGTAPTLPTYTPVDNSFVYIPYRKTNLTIQSGGTVTTVLDVVLDEVSGMWYEWTGALPHTFSASPSTPTQSYAGWICRGMLTRWPTNDPRNFGAHSRYELGFVDFDSTDAIQLMVDAQRLSLPNAGANYTLDYTSRQLLDFNGMVYNVSRPISCQDDVVTGHRASGLKIKSGGLRALAGFTGQTQVKNSAGDTEVIKSFLIFGVKNYATQSGQWQGWTCVDDFSFDGNGFKVDDPIYLDVSAYGTYTNIKCRQVRRGWKSKVAFLSNFSNWQMNDCNGIYYMVNTSIADGYNGGLGLEGGGNTLDGLTITGDGDGDQSVNRLHQDRIGEITCSNVISYNGLGDFLVVTADTGSASGTKWSRWKGIEVGDLGGRIFNLKNASYLDIELTVVKCGRLLGNKALGLIDTCSYVHITPMVDQFYDLPSAWTSSIAFMDCVGCRVNDGTVRSIPHADNTSHLISFLGNCVDCSVGDITTNLGSYAKRYVSPVHSDPTCVNTSVVGGTFLTGVFISPTPDLNGAGDNYTGVNINGQVQDSPRRRRALQAESGAIAATHFEMQKILPTVSSAGANLVTIDFTSVAAHNCSVDIELTAVTPSGQAAYSATHKVMFTRTTSSTGVVSISAAVAPLSQSTTATTLSVAVTEVHTQFQLTISVLPTFGGTSPEAAARIAALVRVNSGKKEIVVS